MKENVKQRRLPGLDVSGIEKTQLLFYDNEDGKDFTAKVLKNIRDGKRFVVILDRRFFYPEGGGQDFDNGTINGKESRKGGEVRSCRAHKVKDVHFREGDAVNGSVNWDRRLQHAQHHTAVHIINGAARKMLGNHVWQAVREKTLEKAHLA